jgi:Transposase and inactivated derivatives
MDLHEKTQGACRKLLSEISDSQYGAVRKVFASLLYEGYSCENQAADEDYSNAKILGIDYAMQGMAVFSEEIELEKAGFFRRNEKRLAREQRKLSRCVKESRNYVRQKKKVARCHEKIRNQRRDYLHKLSRRITDQYDIVAVEDIDMKAMPVPAFWEKCTG